VANQVEAVRSRALPELAAGHYQTWATQIEEIHAAIQTALLERSLEPTSKAGQRIEALLAKALGLDALPGSADHYWRAISETMAEAYALGSQNALLNRAAAALIRGLDPADVIEERLKKWENSRAKRRGRDEAHRISQAQQLEAYERGGVKRFGWQLRGSRNCPWCRAMNGKIISTGETFAEPGRLAVDGRDDTLKVRSRMRHPPLHRACDCRLVPIRD
jgi:hypothetical protein